jgi:DNA-binding protein Alba
MSTTTIIKPLQGRDTAEVSLHFPLNTESAGNQQRQEIFSANTLLVGQKRAGHYLAPAILRLESSDNLVIRARGSLNISTAVDVAEIVRKNIKNVTVESIQLGTEELADNTLQIKRRLSFIEIQIAKNQTTANITQAEAESVKKPSQGKKTKTAVTRKQSKKKKKESETGASV